MRSPECIKRKMDKERDRLFASRAKCKEAQLAGDAAAANKFNCTVGYYAAGVHRLSRELRRAEALF